MFIRSNTLIKKAVFFILMSMIRATVYDETKLNYFSMSLTSTLLISSDVYKHGDRSIKWIWFPKDSLTLHLYHNPVIKNQLKHGGIKLWLYLRQRYHGNITVSFYTSYFVNTRRATSQPECRFNISLEFQGWRTVWVGFDECRLHVRMLPIYRMVFQVSSEYFGEIYIDLLRIIRSEFKGQSRDHILPPIKSLGYPSRGFWQQTYRWSLVKPKIKIFNEIELNVVQFEKLKHIRLIRTRLEEWFDNRQVTYDFKKYFKTQWYMIKKQMKKARRYFKTLNITRNKSFIQGVPLFSRNSEYGKLNINSKETKFGTVMRKVLYPLAFEYFFLNRRHEIDRTIKEELSKLNNKSISSRTVKNLTGYDKELMAVFYRTSKIKLFRLSRYRLRFVLREINRYRLQRLLLLLDYILDQGWQVGSGLGSLDHEMNRSSKGFITSIFLLRLPLRKIGKLSQFIDIMKWYLEFGEVYQTPSFEYNGTTCDRMRTLMLYRLMSVTIMPEVTLKQSLDKLHDMQALKDWYENALKVNTGLNGVIKPDYTGFHHKSFYPNDYVLPALIIASQVVYLLRGTKYEIHVTSRRNLKNAIHFMRILSVKYTIPNNVANSHPTSAKPELICLIPAFAYVTSAEIESRNADVMSGMENMKVFLRMLNESNADVQAYLSKGKRCSWMSSLVQSFGSLALVFRLKKYAKDHGIEAEQSPQGTWAKNYAALMIHRRENWAVTVKGFNNFVWGHESSDRGNHYGLYQSYGQLIIANSDHALRAYDISHGWDWTRLPGTTTLRVDVKQLLMEHSRFYNPKKLCGGISFKGTSRFKNGAFVMDFERPIYKSFDQDTQFWFKKSVFFYNDIIVCIGSNINAKHLVPVEVETTLFQNLAIIDRQVQSINTNGYKLHVTKIAQSFIWGENSAGILMDVNNNGYYVKNAGKQNLRLWFGPQTSYHHKFTKARTKGYFATSYLRHGANPGNISYEYAVLVNTTYQKLYNFVLHQQKLRGLKPKYEIIKQDKFAHVVKFNNAPQYGRTTYAYNIFVKDVELPGPLWMVGDPCVIMVEDGGNKSSKLILGVSYPQMNFNTSKRFRTSYDVKEDELFYMKSQDKQIWILLKQTVNINVLHVYVNGVVVCPTITEEHVAIIPDDPNGMSGSVVLFKKLCDGFTTEVHLKHNLSTVS